MTAILITEATEAADRDACYGVRTAVFCDEQGVPAEIEFDGLDDRCRHYLARIGRIAVGTARVRPLGGGQVKFERVAVLRTHRRAGIGLALMERALAGARSDGHRHALLHAQTHAGEFYRRLGFRQEGEGFMEAGIPHIRMSMAL
jgi:predicted GNAT family N-acyltransferase